MKRSSVSHLGDFPFGPDLLHYKNERTGDTHFVFVDGGEKESVTFSFQEKRKSRRIEGISS